MEKKWKLFLTVWTAGILGGVLFWLLKLTKRVEVFGYKNLLRYLEEFAPKNKPLLVMSNHPSLWEPGLLPFLFFPWYLFSLRFVPFSLPDKKNYYDKRWFAPLKSVSVPIERGNIREELRTIKILREMLKEGKILILFPEGGRTSIGKEFRFSCFEKRIRAFPLGIEKLFENNCLILPIWTEGGELVIPNKETFLKGLCYLLPKIWRKTRIFIGQSFELEVKNFSKGQIKEYLESILLKLADEYWNEKR